MGPLECQSLAAMQSLMDTNFFGLVRLVKEVLPDMKRRRGGHIVVISSIMGLQGRGGGTTRGALVGPAPPALTGTPTHPSRHRLQRRLRCLQIRGGGFLREPGGAGAALQCGVSAGGWRPAQPPPPGQRGFGGAGVPSTLCPGRISLVEPGPVTTEFEAKLYEEAERTDYSRTDPETADIFTNLYLRNSKDVFASLGQTPEDIAEVTGRWVALPGRGLPSSHPPGLAWQPQAGLGCLEKPQLSPNEVQRPPAGSGAGSPPRQLLPPELHPDGAEPSWERGWDGDGIEIGKCWGWG